MMARPNFTHDTDVTTHYLLALDCLGRKGLLILLVVGGLLGGEEEEISPFLLQSWNLT